MKFYFRPDSIKYAKILYKDGNLHPNNHRVAIKEINEREIIACTKFEDGLDILVPQEVTLSIVCNDGIYKSKTILKSYDNDEPYTFFIMDTPTGIEYEQNREYFRIAYKSDCLYKVMVNESIMQYSAEIYDISANGISIILPECIISELPASLEINLDGRILEVKVDYVRSEKKENGYRIAFTFSKLSESIRDYISQVCIKKQLEERRKNLK